MQNFSALSVKQEKTLGGSSGPSSLTTDPLPAAYRRASEGGANLYKNGPKNKIISGLEKNNEI